jgi:hypothetical protein
MSPLILLGLLAGVPLVLLTLLRVKPLYIFVSTVTGYLWVQYLGEPADLTLRSLVRVDHPDVVARIGLLLIPVVLTLILMRKSLPTSALPFQFFLLVANSLLLAVLIINLLPSGVQTTLYATNAGNVVRQANDVLIAGVAGLHVLVMWIMRPKHHDAHSKHKKHH